MKRIAIFAHYDKHNLIDDYVVFYLKKLKEVVDEIIFISDCNIEKRELSKINHLILDKVCTKHDEYDFGSYKRGFFLLKEKHPEKFNELEELVFVNDSCYCVGDFKEIFNKIKKDKRTEYIGLTENNEINYHLQSYFLVIRKYIFKEDFFVNFLKNVKKLKNKETVIKNYEIGLSNLLINNNKKICAIFSCKKINEYVKKNNLTLLTELNKILHNNNDKQTQTKIMNNLFNLNSQNHIHSNKYFFLIKMGFPLLKRLPLDNNNIYHLNEDLFSFWKEVIKEDFYIKLIIQNLNRLKIQPRKKPSEETFFENLRKYLKTLIKRKKNFFQYKKTNSGKVIIKIFKIPIFHSKLLKN